MVTHSSQIDATLIVRRSRSINVSCGRLIANSAVFESVAALDALTSEYVPRVEANRQVEAGDYVVRRELHKAAGDGIAGAT